MLRLNRITEYSLIALTYIRSKPDGSLTSAREISDRFELPFEILAKTLQKLKDQGVIASTYGTRGGYQLTRDLSKLSLAEFLAMMEGPVSVVACQSGEPEQADCGYHNQCNIRVTMSSLNERFHRFLREVTVEEITRTPNDIMFARPTAPLADEAAVRSFAVGEEP